MIQRFLIIVVISFLSACSSNNLKSRNIEEYYQSAGVEKYFLSDIPNWANFSETAECYRKTNIRYFDLKTLMSVYGIKYERAIQIQAMFNYDSEHILNENVAKRLTMSEEQLMFFNASEKVNGKINFFTAPTYKRIHLIWIDDILKNEENKKKLFNFLKSPINDEGVPVLVSMCLTKKEIEDIFPDQIYKMISAEMFSIYSPDGERAPFFRIFFDQYFKAEQEVNFYSIDKVNKFYIFNGVKKFINIK